MLNYNRVRRVLKTWGDKLSEKLKNYLQSDGFKATGGTIEQIKPKVSKKGETLNLQFESKAKVGKSKTYTIVDIIDKGRKKNSPIEDRPPYKAIEEWILAKGVTIRNQNSGKFAKRSELNVRRAAIAISRSINKEGTIKRKGGRGADLYNKLFIPEQEAMKLQIADAYEKDVQAYMKRQNKNIK